MSGPPGGGGPDGTRGLRGWAWRATPRKEVPSQSSPAVVGSAARLPLPTPVCPVCGDCRGRT
eukprot:scaffold1254_cov376-Prasinococcus_capsulatus_cf.AAC.11